MSEPSALAAGSRAGSSQGRDGVVALSCARAGAGPSNGTSGATSDSARPSNAAAEPAIFGTLNSILPALRPTSAHFKFDAFAGRTGATLLGRRGASGAARNPLDFSAGWIARGRSISHARYLTNRLACPMTLALPQEKNW